MSIKKKKVRTQKDYFITTPIYYWNGIPHIGHAYSSILADTIARYKKISGFEVRFSTWIDENSQKVVESAEKEWISTMEFLDDMSDKHKKVWEKLDINYTDFVRTTEPRHKNIVQDVLQKCHSKWDIYKWNYEGLYCVWCEAFKKETDLVDYEWKRVCLDHLKEPDKISEENYFFKLSSYETWLKEFYDKNPDFLEPHFSFNKIKDFVYDWLEDFSISRENAKFGIPLPFDETHITYVWFDALFNYYTACKYSKSTDRDATIFKDETEFFPPNLHVVWKDIIRFHAIYWPAMLASYFDLWEKSSDGTIHFVDSDKLYLPHKILSTWFLQVDWQKMSKSLWNVINPVEYVDTYNKDLLVLSLLWDFNIWTDWNYDKNNAILKYNAKLANNFWNLLNRVVVLTVKSWWTLDIQEKSDLELNFDKIYVNIDKYNLKTALDKTFSTLDKLNKYIVEKEPWKLLKTDIDEANRVLYILAEWLRQVWLCLYPFFPLKMEQLFTSLWLKNYSKRLEKGELNILRKEEIAFNITAKSDILYPQFEV